MATDFSQKVWVQYETDDGQKYYYNRLDDTTTFEEPPLDELMPVDVARALHAPAAAAATGKSKTGGGGDDDDDGNASDYSYSYSDDEKPDAPQPREQRALQFLTGMGRSGNIELLQLTCIQQGGYTFTDKFRSNEILISRYRNGLVEMQGIEQFTNLLQLELGANHFTTFPLGILALKFLARLSLYENYLTVVPDLSPLSELEELQLQSNLLTDVPVGLDKLLKLKRLYLHDNKLACDFHIRNKAMEDLSINDNPQLTVHGLGELNKLTRLKIDAHLLPSKLAAMLADESEKERYDFDLSFARAARSHFRATSWRFAHGLLVDWTLALAPLALPVHVLLLIFDWIESMHAGSSRARKGRLHRWRH